MIVLLTSAVLATAAVADDRDFDGTSSHHHHGNGGTDFGEAVELVAKSLSLQLYGTLGVLGQSSTLSLSAEEANANPAKLLKVAPGLKVRVLSAAANLAPNIDQMFLYPKDRPTHIIACNEQGSSQVGVQRINIKTGVAENIISSGLTSCDPARLTPWGTVIVGEENGSNGRIIEILDPLHTNNVTVPPSGHGPTSDPDHVVTRPAMGQFAFEGIGILPNGIVYLTDENRPGTGGVGNPGGALVKFIPSVLWTPGSPAITNLAQSPWTAGRIFGMRLGLNSLTSPDAGQGNEFGRGVWVEVAGTAPINLRAAALALKLTAYYRPEDMSIDLEELADGNVRFCGTNTGQDVPAAPNAGDNHWGEVYCVTDGTVADGAAINTVVRGTDTINVSTVPEYHPLVLGNLDFAMPDNVDIQPGTGNFLINEDGEGPIYTPPRNNDIWACLDDGDDADHLADNCVKLMTLNDLTAESTGGFFDASGTHYYVSIQHNITGHGVILQVDGWHVPRHGRD
jgi:secreted PhoX family phosphatase